MAFQAQKVSREFEKWAPGWNLSLQTLIIMLSYNVILTLPKGAWATCGDRFKSATTEYWASF